MRMHCTMHINTGHASLGSEDSPEALAVSTIAGRTCGYSDGRARNLEPCVNWVSQFIHGTVPRFVLCLRGRPIRRPNNAAAASKRAHCQPARRRPFIRRGPIITHDYPLFQSNQLAGVHRQQEITFCCCSRCMAGCLWGRDPVHKWLQVVRSPVRIPTRSASFCADR